MKPDTPILMITLQIPILPDTSAEDVLDAIAQQVSEALMAIQAGVDEDSDLMESLEEIESSTKETDEPFSDITRDDILSRLGYTAEN